MATNLDSVDVVAGDDILAAEYNTLRKDLIRNAGDYETAGGTANALTLAIDAAYVAYAAGDVVRALASADNTDAVTINVNGIGAQDIKRLNGDDLLPGDIKSGMALLLHYDGTNFQLMSTGGDSNIEKLTIQGVDIAAGDFVAYSVGDNTKVELLERTLLDSALDTETMTAGDLYKIDDETFLSYETSGSNVLLKKWVIDRGAGTMTQSGSTATLALGASGSGHKYICGIGGTLVAVVGSASGGSGDTKAVIVDYSDMSQGTVATIAASIGSGDANIEIGRVDDDKFAVVHKNSSNDLVFSLCTVSGTTITVASTSTLATTAGTNWINDFRKVQMVEVEDNLLAVGFFFPDTTDDFKLTRLSISGTTITPSTSTLSTSAENMQFGFMVRYKTNNIILGVSDSSNIERIYKVDLASSISATQITDFQPDTEWDEQRVFIPLKADSSNNTYLFMTLSRNVQAIGFAIWNDNTNYLTLLPDMINTGSSTYNFNRGIALRTPEDVEDEIDVILTNPNGTNTIEYRRMKINGQRAFGVALEAGSETQDIYVQTLGLADVFTGLTADTKYYIDRDGSLTTSKTAIEAGIAKSTTSIDLTFKKTKKVYDRTPVYAFSTEQDHFGLALADIGVPWSRCDYTNRFGNSSQYGFFGEDSNKPSGGRSLALDTSDNNAVLGGAEFCYGVSSSLKVSLQSVDFGELFWVFKNAGTDITNMPTLLFSYS